MSKFRSILITLLSVIAVSISSCGSPVSNEQPSNSNARDASKSGGARIENTPSETRSTSGNAACYEVEAGTKTVLRSQTFAIDFEPFRNSCFVTSHDPKFKDPPLESEIAIYKNGKKVFDFPEQFNGITVGCWVEAVAFQDVNSDKLTDVIVVGKCGGKSGSFNANTVYLNDGRTFTTNMVANDILAKFETVKEISEYVKQNPDLFRPTAGAPAS